MRYGHTLRSVQVENKKKNFAEGDTYDIYTFYNFSS